MFILEQTTYGITVPIAMIYVNDVQGEHAESDVTMTAEQSDDELDLVGMTGSMRFHDGTTEYTAPFQGSDFLSGKTGTLYIRITDTLAVGVYDARLQDTHPLYGVCGWGVSGMIQAGNVMAATQDLGLVVRIQSLPDDWETLAAIAAQPYGVPMITRPY